MIRGVGVIGCAVILVVGTAACDSINRTAVSEISTSPAVYLRLSSTEFPDGGTVAPPQVSQRCGGQNVSPDLAWTPGPPGTVAYAVTLHDPDAPTSGGFWHWIAFDIPYTSTSLPSGVQPNSPAARQAANQAGQARYDGPCPPAGKPHRYVVTVTALKQMIDLPDGAPNAQVRSLIDADKLASSTLTATYGRP